MGVKMSFTNNHGLGYTAVSPDGSMFGERWLKNDEAFDVRAPHSEVAKKYKSKMNEYKGFLDPADKDALTEEVKYNKFGVLSENISAITLHTRWATSGKEFMNTHPFVDHKAQTSLIHNGVIGNVVQADHIRSTCDSERILNRYLENVVAFKPSNIDKAVNELTGSFACGVIAKDSKGSRFVDIFKNNSTSLGAVYVKELGCMVFTTQVDDIKDVCKKIGMEIDSVFNVTANKLLRLDALTGKVMLTEEFDHKPLYDLHGTSRGRHWSREDYDHMEWSTELGRMVPKKKLAAVPEEPKPVDTATIPLLEDKTADEDINELMKRYATEAKPEDDGFRFNDDGTVSKNERKVN